MRFHYFLRLSENFFISFHLFMYIVFTQVRQTFANISFEALYKSYIENFLNKNSIIMYCNREW